MTGGSDTIADGDDRAVRLFVGGRLCMFGEHSDWAADYGFHQGFCIVAGTDQGISGKAQRSSDLLVSTRLPEGSDGPADPPPMHCNWKADELLTSARNPNEFLRYCAGVAYEMRDVPGVSGGIHIGIDRVDLPLRKGVSSSAAVCVLVARAFNAVYDLRLFPHEVMEFAYRGERLTGSRCGRMDQACIYGKTPMLLTFDRDTKIRLDPIPVGCPIYMFLVDLRGRKDTVRILSDLRRAYPGSDSLRSALGEMNEDIVRQATQAICMGDPATLGRLMTEAQGNFDRLVAPHCPEHLASPLLHDLLACQAIAPHVHGGKGVGSQGDGTAQFVARSSEDRQAAITAIAKGFPEMRCFPLTISGNPAEAKP